MMILLPILRLQQKKRKFDPSGQKVLNILAPSENSSNEDQTLGLLIQ